MSILFTVLITAIMMFTNLVTVTEGKTITVTVVNANSREGKIVYALFDKEGFLRIPLQGKSPGIVDGKNTIVFTNVPAGEYAVTCYYGYWTLYLVALFFKYFWCFKPNLCPNEILFNSCLLLF